MDIVLTLGGAVLVFAAGYWACDRYNRRRARREPLVFVDRDLDRWERRR